MARVFDRFYRGSSKAQHAGSGMGLSIARGLLAVESGRIWAENRPGQGAAFTIAVPVETRSAEAEAEA
jgi:signal transduction histidine kinase